MLAPGTAVLTDRLTGTLLILIGILLFVLGACGSGSGSGGGSAGSIHAVIYPNIGYSATSAWPTMDRKTFVQAHQKLGLTEIEWVTPTSLLACPPGSPRPYDWFGLNPKEATDYAILLRDFGIRLYVNIANMNNCAVTAQGDDWFKDQLAQALSLPGDVIISGVSEPWANSLKAAHWLALAQKTIPADRLVAPSGYPGAFEDRHYRNLDMLMRDLSTPRPRVIFNTDCSPILDPGPAVAQQLSALANGNGNTLLIYENRHGPDYETIAAMSNP